MATFFSLPEEIVLKIVDTLSWHELFHLRNTNHTMRAIIHKLTDSFSVDYGQRISTWSPEWKDTLPPASLWRIGNKHMFHFVLEDYKTGDPSSNLYMRAVEPRFRQVPILQVLFFPLFPCLYTLYIPSFHTFLCR